MATFLAHSSNDPERIAPQTMREHAINVAQLASGKAVHFGAEHLAHAAGLLHDLGKYTEAFQKRLAGGARVDHATRGAMMAKQLYGPMGTLLAYGIAGHHGGLPDGIGLEGKRTALDRRFKDATLPALDAAWQAELQALLPDPVVMKAFFQALKLNQDSPGFSLAFLVRMVFSALVDADFLDTEKYYDQFLPDGEHRAVSRAQEMPSLAELRTELDAFMANLGGDTEVNRIRSEVLKYARSRASEGPGMFSLNVPTGGGKTLTSLAFALDHAIAHGQRRVIFVIPFTSIVEQNAAVFRKALGQHGERAVLEHHSAFSQPPFDKSDPDKYQAQAKLRLAMENWDAPIVVTTAVQFFESMFAARPGQCRKLHNMANSVIILDEAQTIPLKVLVPAVLALKELASNYRCSVVLCTATQPALEKPGFGTGFDNVRALVRDEAALAEQLKRVTVRHVGVLDDEALSARLREQEQVLCIVNNRLHARALYESVREEEGAVHLSTLMCARHRSETLEEVRQRLKGGKPCRLISTSLIEAGVDVSFPRVLRAEAGLDSIAQAAGRCNRNKEWLVEKSLVEVFSNGNPDWAAPPELRQFAQVATEIMRLHKGDLLAPDAIKAYFEQLYWQKGNKGLDGFALQTLLRGVMPDTLPMETLASRFCMIESRQRTVIVPWDDVARKNIERLQHVDKPGAQARSLQPYTVQVPRQAYEELLKFGAIQAVAGERFGDQFMVLVHEGLYQPEYGLTWDNPCFIDAEKMVL